MCRCPRPCAALPATSGWWSPAPSRPHRGIDLPPGLLLRAAVPARLSGRVCKWWNARSVARWRWLSEEETCAERSFHRRWFRCCSFGWLSWFVFFEGLVEWLVECLVECLFEGLHSTNCRLSSTCPVFPAPCR